MGLENEFGYAGVAGRWRENEREAGEEFRGLNRLDFDFDPEPYCPRSDEENARVNPA